MNRRTLLRGSGLVLAAPFIHPAAARLRIGVFPFPGASYHLSFKRKLYYWGGKGRVSGDFTSFTLGAGTLDAFGLTPASDTVITIATSALGQVIPGSAIIVCTATGTPGAARRPFEFHDGTVNERITFTQATTAGNATLAVVDNGVVQVNSFLGSGGLVVNRRSALAASWTVDNVVNAANGIAGGPDSVATMPTVTTMQIGKGSAASTQFLGYIEEVIGFSRALTQSECNNLSALIAGL